MSKTLTSSTQMVPATPLYHRRPTGGGYGGGGGGYRTPYPIE
ncbi:hypothetical protein BH09MYX1_BH09MYX1_35470 [soil metagenome]